MPTRVFVEQLQALIDVPDRGVWPWRSPDTLRQSIGMISTLFDRIGLDYRVQLTQVTVGGRAAAKLFFDSTAPKDETLRRCAVTLSSAYSVLDANLTNPRPWLFGGPGPFVKRGWFVDRFVVTQSIPAIFHALADKESLDRWQTTASRIFDSSYRSLAKPPQTSRYRYYGQGNSNYVSTPEDYARHEVYLLSLAQEYSVIKRRFSSVPRS
jgi:hypothetical protein